MGEAPHLFCLGIEFVLKNNPPKSIWRGKTAPKTTRKPAKTVSAGKNAPGLHEIARQTHFGGLSCTEPMHQNEIKTAKKTPPQPSCDGVFKHSFIIL
jgi:hypothetical protein